MHKTHAKDGLALVTVNVDDPTDNALQEKVRQYLGSQNASGTNLVADMRDDPGWEKLKLRVMPTTFIYDREGKLAERFEGFEEKALEAAVKRAIKK